MAAKDDIIAAVNAHTDQQIKAWVEALAGDLHKSMADVGVKLGQIHQAAILDLDLDKRQSGRMVVDVAEAGQDRQRLDKIEAQLAEIAKRLPSS